MTGRRGGIVRFGNSGRLAILAGILVISAARAAPAKADSPWRTDFQQAQTEAERLGRPLLLHFSAEWCAPCQKMKHDVLSDPGVLKELGNRVVPVRVDADEHPDLARRFKVRALPTDVYVEPGGRVLARFEGYQTRETYLARMARMESRSRRSEALHTVEHGDAAPSWTEEASVGEDSTVSSDPDTPKRRRIVESRADEDPVGRESSPVNEGWAVSPNPGIAEPGAGGSLEPNAEAGPLTGQSRAPTAADDPFGQPDEAGRPRTAASAGDSQTESQRREFAASRSPHRRSSAPPPLGLDGYSPVSLQRERRWRKGRKEFSAVYRGVAYRMASRDELQAFHSNPSRYAPRLSGRDPVELRESGSRAAGSVRFAAYFGEDLYLFKTAENRARFKQSPDRYAE